MTSPSTAAAVEAPVSTRRERVGFYFYDWANSAFSTTVISVFLGPYLTSIAENAAGCGTDANPCDTETVSLLGLHVAPESVFPYAVSLSVILQVLVLPVTGAIADRTRHRKQLLALLAYIGAGATIALLFLTGDRYLLGAGLFVLANLAFGASAVVYNSFLPGLAKPDDRDTVSSIGWAIGYLGGGLLLLLNLVALIFLQDTWGKGEIARWSIVSAGVWWAAFTTIPLANLRNFEPLAGEHRGSALLDGFRQLGNTLAHLRNYKITLFFLIAYLIYNDGIQTVIAMASVYADKQLGLSQNVQVQTILLVQFLAFGGAILLGRLAKRYGAWKTVLASLVLWTFVLVAAYFMPAKLGVDNPAPNAGIYFMLLGAFLGIVLGGSQALSRSLFSQLIPQGREGEYFGLYEISDKGTSWTGPLIFGLAYDLTRDYRIAIISLVILFVVGFLGLLAIPVRRGIVAAGNTPPHVL